ncbi:MAG: hypothetical protein C4524_14640 [Candidatus Zixiibacteriota bacterium]|nr:MAG: hypothetical protein C4524_14640 [candidate division Zixibacteria bacterium]
MKRILTGLLAAALLAALAWAGTDPVPQNPQGRHPAPRPHRHAAGLPQPGPNFVDADSNGVCDHAPDRAKFRAERRQRMMNRDADGDGIPNGRDPDFQHRFVDENRDGVCDFRATPPPPAPAPEPAPAPTQ